VSLGPARSRASPPAAPWHEDRTAIQLSRSWPTPPRSITETRNAGSGTACSADCPLWSVLAGQSGPDSGSAAGAGEERGHDVGGVPVERDSRPVVAHGRAGIGVAGGLLDVAQRHTSVKRGVMNAWRRVWGPTRLAIAAWRAMRRTIRPAA
jgi:hypothetical protein